MEPNARDIIYSLPSRLKPDKAVGEQFTIHLNLEGEGGGLFTVTLQNEQCKVEDGHQGTADCTVTTTANTYVGIETGKTNPTMAFMTGAIKVSNIPVMMKFIQLFER